MALVTGLAVLENLLDNDGTSTGVHVSTSTRSLLYKTLAKCHSTQCNAANVAAGPSSPRRHQPNKRNEIL